MAKALEQWPSKSSKPLAPSTESERLAALGAAVTAFLADRDARNEALITRQALTISCVDAHAVGISDQQLADAFAKAAKTHAVLSRARIQQIRTKENN